MSLLPKETISVIAQSARIQNISDDVASHLAPDAEYRLRDIIETAAKFMRHSKRDILKAEDINNALKIRNVHQLYGFSSRKELKFRKVSKGLYYVEDEEVNLAEVLKNTMKDEDLMKSCPLDVSLTSHWLAVEGIQPQIAENPSIADAEGEDERHDVPWRSVEDVDTGEGVMKMNVANYHKVSMELEKYFGDIIGIIRKGKRSSKVMREEAIKSLSQDAGIHQLVPYFSQFVADEVAANLRNLDLQFVLMRVVEALLKNPHVHVELYLHQLIPSIITCLLAKDLCENPYEDHWSLRDYAASVIEYICTEYGDSYRTLQPRITRTLIRVFMDLGKPLTTHYGSIVGLSALGPTVFRTFLLPNAALFGRIYEPAFSSKSLIKRMEASRCFHAMMAAIGTYLCGLSLSNEELFLDPALRTPKKEKTTSRSSKKRSYRKMKGAGDDQSEELEEESSQEPPTRMEQVVEQFGQAIVVYYDNPLALVTL